MGGCNSFLLDGAMIIVIYIIREVYLENTTILFVMTFLSSFMLTGMYCLFFICHNELVDDDLAYVS